MSLPRCVVVVLTFNAATTISETIAQARKVSSQVYVVDSGSTDGTLQLLRQLGCEVVHRPFVNYSDQRNWAIAQVQERAVWQLHLDADEVLDDRAIAEIQSILEADAPEPAAWMLRRRDYFMGCMLRFSGLNPWHLRLFRAGAGRCEDRLYDQHFVTEGPVGRLQGWMHDKNAVSLGDWIARHNRWSDLEAAEMAGAGPVVASGGVLQPRLLGDARERTRFLKGLYYRLPGGVRALAYFLYRYVVRLGFLDGVPGFYFAFFQALWFRLLVDAKLGERRKGSR